ncbi:hypothetical protein TWF970_008439 [Orbilia oligospora]|uniref:Uncharacterized protein n=1 Tax=Orbilia oligospora TaxID=2813651 RepID=A0A7C8RGQ8_ORBOL|nr:hypothetical protein TWF970_008439 [Orbilia oligospora]
MLCQELGLLLAESMTPMIRAVGVMLRRLRQEMTVAPARNRELLERQFQFWLELEEALDQWHRSLLCEEQAQQPHHHRHYPEKQRYNHRGPRHGEPVGSGNRRGSAPRSTTKTNQVIMGPENLDPQRATHGPGDNHSRASMSSLGPSGNRSLPSPNTNTAFTDKSLRRTSQSSSSFALYPAHVAALTNQTELRL